ncbi:hypothetical protein ACTQ6A_02820 [Lachnospiraceae bacterium LCP25S3_G4]
MNINISEIVNKKIEELEEEKTIEKAIEETFQSSIVKAVKEALESYSLIRTIEEKMSTEVSSVVADIDFTTYNGFIAEKMKEIVEQTCRTDLCEKIESTFKSMFMCERKSIALSEIFEKYREIVCEKVDEAEKYDRQYFHVKFEENETYHWIDVELDEEKKTGSWSDAEIKFAVHKREDGTGWISTLYLNGISLDRKMKFGSLNDVELMLVQAVYNKIPIVMDVESQDEIEDYYDVDF